MNKPEYVKIDNVLYPINTDFRVVIECNRIAQDKTIGDTERAMAIIYKLFGADGLDCTKLDKMLELGMKYMRLNNNKKISSNLKGKNEIDISKCEGLIRSSFKFDYGYDPYELEYLHWYDFYNDLENLSTSEFGTCCPLNRIINVLNQNPNDIKDVKEKQKLIECQELLKEKYCVYKEPTLTEEQEESSKAFYESLGIKI